MQASSLKQTTQEISEVINTKYTKAIWTKPAERTSSVMNDKWLVLGTPFNCTRCFLSLKNAFIQSIKSECKLYLFNLRNNLLCGTLSNDGIHSSHIKLVTVNLSLISLGTLQPLSPTALFYHFFPLINYMTSWLKVQKIYMTNWPWRVVYVIIIIVHQRYMTHTSMFATRNQ